MRAVLDLSNVMAYKYFMEPANYCSVDLPIYIDFKPILDFVEKKLEVLDLKIFLKTPIRSHLILKA